MTSSRHTKIPIEHVKAELATFPLVSEISLSQNIVELCPKLSPSSQTRILWQEAERMLVNRFPGNSIDDARSMRDQIWFSTPHIKEAVPLHKYLQGLALDYLEPQGFVAVPRLPRCLFPHGDSRRHKPMARQTWWWLSIALPPDFLLAALHRKGEQPIKIDAISPLLSQQLADNGYAETHLHLGVGIDFRTLWTSSLIAIAQPEFTHHNFHSVGAQLNDGKLLAPWLIRASIVRYVIAAYMYYRKEGHYKNLEDFIATFVRLHLLNNNGHYSLLLYVMSELQQGHLINDNFVDLQQLYRELIGCTPKTVDSLEELEALDPIYSFCCSPDIPVDISYISKGLTYCETYYKTDKLFARLFWQNIRIQALLYRHTVQRPLTRGLEWFVRFYGRSSPSRKPLSKKLYIESAAKLCGVNHGLKSLEVRTSPKRDIKDLLILITDLKEQVEKIRRDFQSPFEFGLVLHFTKNRGGQQVAFELDSYKNPSPDKNTQGFRFQSFLKQKECEYIAVERLLIDYPDALQILRGLDVCTDELGIPNWVIAPMIKKLRKLSCQASSTLRNLTHLEIPPLKMTAHAGEDFIHLLTGLRNIDQAIDLFDLTQGDRLGHCIALGIDPVNWAESIGKVSISQEDRLFDLIWLWKNHGANEWWQDGHQNMEYELSELINSMFGKIIDKLGGQLPTKCQLVQLMSDLTNSQKLEAVGFPFHGGKIFNHENLQLKLLFQYLTNYSIFIEGQRLKWIAPELEAKLLSNIQNELRSKIGTMGITIEVNPSSNQLIGDFSDLKTHPLWRLSPPRPLDNVPPINICIGSDDPLLFTSDLRQEYQKVHDALILAGLSEQEVDNWINKVRKNGLNSRFTLPVKFFNTQTVNVGSNDFRY